MEAREYTERIPAFGIVLKMRTIRVPIGGQGRALAAISRNDFMFWLILPEGSSVGALIAVEDKNVSRVRDLLVAEFGACRG